MGERSRFGTGPRRPDLRVIIPTGDIGPTIG